MKDEIDINKFLSENLPDLKEFIEQVVKMTPVERARVQGYMEALPRERKTA